MNTYRTLLTLLSMAATFGNQCTPEQKETTRPLTLGQSIVVGGLVGAAEVAFPGQPLSYAMNQAIKKEPFAWSNSYKGFAVNAVGQMPITALQKAVQAKSSQWLEASQGAQLSDWQKAGVSYTAGVAGALVDTPSNTVQLYLQNPTNKGKTTEQACKELGMKSFRGFGPNAFLKEGLFAVGYQMLAEKGTDVAQEYVGNNLAAVALGGAGAGVVTAVVTHPGAVMRTKMQNDPHRATYTTSWQTMQKIFQDEGAKGFFNGLSQRGTRVAVAVPLYVLYSTYFTQKAQEMNKHK